MSRRARGDEDRYPPWTSDLEPAPGELRVVHAFVNTRDIEQGTDEWTRPEDLAAWLARWRLLPEQGAAAIGDEELSRALEVREGLRGLLLANNGEPLDPEVSVRIRRATRGSRLRVRVGEDGAVGLEPAAQGFEQALARLLEIVVVASVDGSWARLKACANDGCRWAFYDFSKNRSGKWCTMQRCGSQIKARAYRRRRRREKEP